MKVFRDISEFSKTQKPVLTLGMFDGVHLGHQALIKKLNEVARQSGGESVILTFDPHPRTVLGHNNSDLQLITTLEEKVKLLEFFGLQNLILHPFTKEFSQLCSTDFVEQLLVQMIGVDTVVIGYDHHFGYNREGNYEQLVELSKRLKFNVIEFEELKIDDLEVGSSKIRRALSEGKLSYAQKALGRNYNLSGKVVHGDKLGRTLGFPTANLEIDTYKLIPADGVYLVDVQHASQTYRGLLSIGTRPTVTQSNERRVEVYILDFDQEIYGENLSLELIYFIRPDQKFNSVEELVTQMELDKDFAQTYCQK